MDFVQSFYLEQYKMLRDEITFTMGQIYSTETYAAIAMAAIYAWLLVDKSRTSSRAVWFLPPCLISVAAIHCLILVLRLSMMGDYLRGIEEVILGKDTQILGWERYKLLHGQLIEKTDFVLAGLGWALGFGVSIAIALRRLKILQPHLTQTGSDQT